jgi:flavorubredoxin
MGFMDTIDIAKFAVQALKVPETEKQSFPVVGSRAWDGYDIIKLCERLSDKTAKVTQVPIQVIRATKGFTRFFQWSWNISDRLSFAEVIATGKALTADMEPVYKVFGLNPGETSSLDEYMQEYFSRIMKKLKEIEYAQAKANKKKAKKNISWF